MGKYRDNCYEAYKEVQEPYVEDECVDKDVAVCDKHWQCTDPNEPLATCSDKVWVDNLEACKYLKKSFCTEVTKYRTIKEPYQKCDQIAYDECNDVPYDKCDFFTKESCQDHPYDHFYQVPYQDCQDVHKLVSEQVSQKNHSEFVRELSHTSLQIGKLKTILILLILLVALMKLMSELKKIMERKFQKIKILLPKNLQK